MTSKTSSVNLFGAAFRDALRKYRLLSAVIFLLSLIFTCTESVGTLVTALRNGAALRLTGGIQPPIADCSFSISGFAGILSYDGFCILVTLLSGILALCTFRFAGDRRTVNVYLSLGITRGKLFTARYLAGAVSLLAASVLPYAVSAGLNLLLYGSSAAMWTAHALYALSFAAMTVFAFSLTALCVGAMGSASEGFFCAGLLLVLPDALRSAILSLFAGFLRGAANPVRFSPLLGFTSDVVPLGETSQFLRFFMPIQSDSFRRGFAHNSSLVAWENPGFSYAVFWLLASAAMFLLGLFLFKRRRAENAGCRGTAPALTFLATLTPTLYCIRLFTTVCFSPDMDKGTQLGIYLLLGMVLLPLLFAVLMLLFIRSRRRVKRLMVYPAAAFAVWTLFGVILVTGFFGYETRVPALDEIASVTVSLPCGAGLAKPRRSGGIYEAWFENENDPLPIALRKLYGFEECLSPLTTDRDLTVATDLHRALIRDGQEDNARCDVSNLIQYTLKNGKTLTRCYKSLSLATQQQAIELLHTDAYRDVLLRVLEGNTGDFDYNPLYADVCLLSKSMTTLRCPAEFGTEKKKLLLRAVAEDMRAGRLPVDFVSDAPPLGSISLLEWGSPYDSAAFVSPFTPALPQNGEVFVASAASIFPGTVAAYNSPYMASVPVYESMTATLAFLEENGLLSYFADAVQPVNARLLPCTPDAHTTYVVGIEELSLEFIGAAAGEFVAEYRKSEGDDTDFTDTGHTLRDIFPATAAVVEDPQTLQALQACTYYQYFVRGNGALVCYEYEDGTHTLGYIPPDDFARISASLTEKIYNDEMEGTEYDIQNIPD